MKRLIFFFFYFLILFPVAFAGKPGKVKNVIVMIPDGTSIGVVSAARWFQQYNHPGMDRLSIDPYLCGTVITHSSNAPIGCSASTTSTYMTGSLLRAKQVAIYPEADPIGDIYPMDSTKAFQPLATLLEASKREQGKSTGLVVTCYFPHATPADCSSHYYQRNALKQISSQMAYNNIDVVFGGGTKYLTNDMKEHFRQTGTDLIEKDLNAFRQYPDKGKLWALFEEKNFPYEYDRDTTRIPSLEEMTKKALSLLSKNKNGFFLMVEGSHVDKAAHANDALGCITEFLAFDKAVGAALEFAKKNKETVVIILPDHATGGFTLGSKGCSDYVYKNLSDLFGLISSFKKTGYGVAEALMKSKGSEIKDTFKEYTGIELTDEEINRLVSDQSTGEGDYMEVANSRNIISSTNNIINSRTCFGFTTGGHVADEVFLAVYHPKGDVPMGAVRNVEINHYLYDVLGLKEPLSQVTDEIFAKHREVFSGCVYEIKHKKGEFPLLIVKKGKNTLEVPAFKSIAYLNGKKIDLGSVTVYIDKNDTFYLPRFLSKQL